MKKVSKLDIISLSVGSIIGWGAFILPGDLFLSEIGLLNSIIGLMIGLLIVLIIERNYSYLIQKLPFSGGEFLYTKKAFGEYHSFICGWFLSLAYICIVPLNATAIALIFNIITKNRLVYKYLYTVQGYSIFLSDIVITSFFIVLLGYLNIKGIKIASFFQRIMVLLLISIIIIFFILIIQRDGIFTKNISSHIYGISLNINNILKIVAISPWAYVGFDCVTQILEELEFNNKVASKLSMFSLIIGFFLYVIILIITAYGVSYNSVLKGDITWATGETIKSYFGEIGIYLLAIALISGVICGINGFYINSSRLLNVMAKEKKAPKLFKKVNKNNIPENAIYFISFLSLLTPWFGRKILVWIVDMSSLGIAIAYFYTSLSAIKIYYLECKKIKISGFFGVIFSIFFINLLVFPIFENSLKKESLIMLFIWSIIGIVYYIKNEKELKVNND